MQRMPLTWTTWWMHAVVAPDARPDLLGAPFGELERQVGVGDQRRAMPDQVRLAELEDPFGHRPAA